MMAQSRNMNADVFCGFQDRHPGIASYFFVINDNLYRHDNRPFAFAGLRHPLSDPALPAQQPQQSRST